MLFRSAAERQRTIQSSLVYGTYEKAIDRESASEMLAARAQQPGSTTPPPVLGSPAQAPSSGVGGAFSSILMGTTGPRGGRHPGLMEKMAGSAVRSIGSGLGREIIRGVLGSLFGGRR